MKKRILIISDTFHPSKDGVVRFVDELASGICDVYHTTLLVPTFPLRYYPPTDDSKYPYKVIRVPVIPVRLHSYFWSLLSPSVFREIYRADIVIHNSFAPLGVFSFLLAHMLRKSQILFTHHNEMEMLHHSFDIPRALKINFAYSAVQIHRRIKYFVYATSKFAIKVKKFTGRTDCMVQVPFVISPPTVIDTKKVKYLRRIFKAEDRRILLYIGRFSGEKNLEVITEVLGELSKRSDVRSVMVGGGYLLEKIRNLAKKKQYDILFPGIIPEDFLWELYSISDFLITPTPHESLSFTVVEAMSQGTIPVVNGNYTEKYLKDSTSIKILDITNPAQIISKVREVLDDNAKFEKFKEAISHLDFTGTREQFRSTWLKVLQDNI